MLFFLGGGSCSCNHVALVDDEQAGVLSLLYLAWDFSCQLKMKGILLTHVQVHLDYIYNYVGVQRMEKGRKDNKERGVVTGGKGGVGL